MSSTRIDDANRDSVLTPDQSGSGSSVQSNSRRDEENASRCSSPRDEQQQQCDSYYQGHNDRPIQTDPAQQSQQGYYGQG